MSIGHYIKLGSDSMGLAWMELGDCPQELGDCPQVDSVNAEKLVKQRISKNNKARGNNAAGFFVPQRCHSRLKIYRCRDII